MSKWLAIFSAVILLAVVGCGANPSVQYTVGQVLLMEDFNNVDAWETYVDAPRGVDFRVMDGVYRASAGSGGYIWGLNQQLHSDVVIEAHSTQVSAWENNAYGVMCRADTSNNGDGYYFLISGDGFYSIGKGIIDRVDPLVDWTHTDVINRGQSANTIRAVCIGDYLALWVNEQFMAEVRDSAYTSGYAGLAVAAFVGGGGGGDVNVVVNFDDLTIWAATIA